MNLGKRILIMGGSCSGKSTLADKLGHKFNLPILHMDLYDPYAVPMGAERDKRKQKINSVICDTIKEDAWVIEGVYEWYSFKERMDVADTLILLYSPVYKRLWCYLKTCVLKVKRHGRSGFSAKNFRMNQVWYMVRKKDAPYNLIDDIAKRCRHLQVIRLKSYKEIDDFVRNAVIER